MKNSLYIPGPPVLLSSMDRSQQEGVLESKVWGHQFWFHVKWKEKKNHLKICILIHSGSRIFSCAGVLIHSCSTELMKLVPRKLPYWLHNLFMFFSLVGLLVTHLYSVSRTDIEAQLCAVICPILFSLLLVRGLFSPPFHGERHSPVLWVEPSAAGRTRACFHAYFWH